MDVQYGFAIINGLATAMGIFLVASGLTLIFGILKILNFSHGSFFMVGAFITASFFGTDISSLPAFFAASLAAGLAVGAIGLVVDRFVFRRLRTVDESYVLIATFAMLLLCEGIVKQIWGMGFRAVGPPELLAGGLKFGTIIVPTYSLFVIAAGLLIFVVLEIAISLSWTGKLVQALSLDAWMTSLMGVNVPLMLAGTVVFGFLLAGMAGGLLLPNQSLSSSLANTVTLHAFAAVIIGGLGSIRGAFYAACILGLTESLNVVLLPDFPGIAVYFAMVGFILLRPNGLVIQAYSRS